MIPAPGFQKPIPYLFETDPKKSNTSLLSVLANDRSVAAPFLAVIK